jgi:RND family efflux transporter MFP subunit
MKNKQFLLFLLGIAILTFMGVSLALRTVPAPKYKTINVANRLNAPEISANGAIHSQDEVTLHFQSGGKVVYLPFKEGDAVKQGQTIARLDTYALQRQLTAALNTYRSTRDTFDQTKDNSANGVLSNSQKYTLDLQNKSGLNNEDSIINDTVKRIVDQNQANLDTSIVNVELANNAIQLATLTSPINGIITHEDVTVPGINVSPATSFSLADPSELVMQANVSSNNIDFVTVGALATIHLDGSDASYPGTVVKIYPQKVTLPTGESVYQVDVANDVIKARGQLGQTGTALIKSNLNKSVTLVPIWLVLSHNSIWVLENNKPILKTVQVGKIHGDTIEITGGLVPNDQIITNPSSVVGGTYFLL